MTTKIPFNNIVKLGQKTMLDSNPVFVLVG